MLGVDRSQQALQSKHWFPCSLAGQLFPAVTTVLVHLQKLAAALFILCPDNLIIKFFGMLSGLNGKNLASRVGSQCCTCFVALHTSKIFFKCSTLCRSPASCHLKNGTLRLYQATNVVMASTHCGWLRLFRRRCSASFTFGNLYRPFRA